jgi:predicted phosphodiesterase
MEVCAICKQPWDEVGSSPVRQDGSIDYRCLLTRGGCGAKRKPVDEDVEVLTENVRLAKQKQQQQDRNRIERKSFREYARVENAVSEYAQEIGRLLKECGEGLKTVKTKVTPESPNNEVGVIQVTDTHFNELVDLPHNKYDMTVASHRLFKLYKESMSTFASRGIKKVVVAFTGDLMNSDRRLDELLNKATSRAKATFVAVDLIKEFLSALDDWFDVSVVSVLGNESRVKDDMSFANNVLSDNYDYTIMNMVKLLMANTGIAFSELDKMEVVVDINGHKCLITHDVQKATNSQKSTQSAIGRYYLNGNPVDCILSGHLHSTKIEYYSYRSQALVGSNEYNEHALNLSGRAGQNIYIFGEDYRHAVSVDLQNYKEGEQFDIDASLVEYECKSHDKGKSNTKIMEIVI